MMQSFKSLKKPVITKELARELALEREAYQDAADEERYRRSCANRSGR